MSGALDHLRQTLGALKLYRLTEGSLVDRELQSYAAGLEPVEAALERIERNAFPSTCDEATLHRWETLLQLPQKPGLPLEQRRQMVEGMLAVTPADGNRAGVLRSLAAVGLAAQLEETPPLGPVVLRTDTALEGYEDLDALKRTAYGMLPAHLAAVFDVGVLTWAQFDQFGLRWSDWDGADFSWQWFDLYGEQLGGRSPS